MYRKSSEHDHWIDHEYLNDKTPIALIKLNESDSVEKKLQDFERQFE